MGRAGQMAEPHLSVQVGCATAAFFEFLAAAAWAGFVAPNLGLHSPGYFPLLDRFSQWQPESMHG